MKIKSFKIFILFVLLLICGLAPVSGFDVLTRDQYGFPAEGDFPAVLNIGEVIECGDYSLQILNQPVLSKSFQAMIASKDLKYLSIRVGIKNNSSQTVGWIAPDSFTLQEIFRNQIFGTYKLDYLMSAKAAAGFSWKPFYSPIGPGETLQTLLVFSVFQEVDNWIFHFSPHIMGESAKGTVQFRLPAVIVQ